MSYADHKHEAVQAVSTHLYASDPKDEFRQVRRLKSTDMVACLCG